MDQHASIDRISYLPWDILDNILGHLPIEDAVRTSIFSRKWRDKWVDLSKLVFDNKSVGNKFHSNEIVTHVLLSHRGKIHTFRLSSLFTYEAEYLDDWILFLGRKNIKELILDLNLDYYYEWPSCLFSCQQLRHLYLTRSFVLIPHQFNTFSNLLSLHLKGFIADVGVLERLIRSCPILETLVLSDFSYDSDRLNIYAPSLKSLYLEGVFKDLYLENCPHLTDGSFKKITRVMNVEQMVQGMAQNFIAPSGCQCHFERLDLSGYFIKFLSTRCVPQGVPFTCDHLKVLELSGVHFFELDEISTILSILRNCSNLKELFISGFGPFFEDVFEFMKAQDQLNYYFGQLRAVKMDIVCVDIEEERYWRSDLELIKLLLACSPILEKMLVNHSDRMHCDLWFMRELLTFERASEQLILKYLPSPQPIPDYNGDQWQPRNFSFDF